MDTPLTNHEYQAILEQYSAVLIEYEGGFGVCIDAIALESRESNKFRFYRRSNYTQIGAIARICAAITQYDYHQRDSKGNREHGGVGIGEAQCQGLTSRFYRPVSTPTRQVSL
jgi:hypothetical protein